MARHLVHGEPRRDPAEEEARKLRQRKAFAYADAIGLTPDMRHDLSCLIPGVDDGSWALLNVEQMNELLCYLEGWTYINHLLHDRA